MDSAKVNIALPAESAKWSQLVGVNLGGNNAYPNVDEAQTVEPWTAPDTWQDLGHQALNETITAIDPGSG
jgi:hypothetical protein